MTEQWTKLYDFLQKWFEDNHISFNESIISQLTDEILMLIEPSQKDGDDMERKYNEEKD